MGKFKKILIGGLIAASIAPTAYAKCSDSTYKTLSEIIGASGGRVSVQQLIEYITQHYFGYGGSAEPAATATPTAKPTAAPTAKPTAAPTAKPTAAPTAKPTAVPTAKPTAAPTAKPTAAPSATASEIELEVFRLVNEERAKYGLPALKWADDLAAVARAHSRDMINRNFFDHTNPDGYSPFDRLKRNGISYRTAAENIAYGQRTPQAVMTAWMNSSGHRANILNANVKEIGVGAAATSGGTIYWTQLFVAR